MELNFQDWLALVATGAFVLFILWDISWDIAKARIKEMYWIPGKALVLSALTVQLVGYFDRKNVDIFGKSRKQQVKLLIDNQLAIDGARLCFCVFLGYVQPEMASAKSGGRWTNIAALALSLSLHVATEVFALEHISDATKLSRGGEFVSSSGVFLVGAASLVIYLGCTILAGKFIRDSLSQKIPQILSENLPNGGDELSSFRVKMLKSWTVAFAWKAQYKLASSAFVPAVGMIVTICVAVVGTNARRLLHHGSNVGLTSYLQCVFVIIGWIVILWRWFMAVSYREHYTNRRLLDVFQITNRFRKLLFLYMRIALNPTELITESYLERKPSIVFWATVAVLTWALFFMMLIPLIILTVVINLLFIISFFSWGFSWILLRLSNVTGLTKMLKNMIDPEDSASTEEDKELLKCKESLEQMFGGVQKDEDVELLWKYHLKSYKQRRPRMEEANKRIQKCQELLKVINVGFINQECQKLLEVINVDENRRRFVKELQSKRPRKMVAVAIIHIMVKLREFGWDEDVEDIIKAYKEIKDLLEFVDCPENIAIDPMDMFGTCNFEAFEVSLEADKHIREIQKKNKQPSGGDVQQSGSRQGLLDSLEKEKENLEDEIKSANNENIGFALEEILGCAGGVVCFFMLSLVAIDEISKKLQQRVDRLLVCHRLGRVGKCLFCVGKSLILFCMIPISLLISPIEMMVVYICFWDDDGVENGLYKDIALKKSLHFVYGAILDQLPSSSLENDAYNDNEMVISCLGNMIISYFRELIACSVEQLPELLIKHSNKWAGEFQEDKISKALEMAEKLRALVKMSKAVETNDDEVNRRKENETGGEDETRIDMTDSK